MTLKWTQVKRSDEIEKIFKKRQSKGFLQPRPTNQLSNAKPSPLIQKIDLDASNNDLMQSSMDEEPENKFYDPATKLLFNLFLTGAKNHSQSQKIMK